MPAPPLRCIGSPHGFGCSRPSTLGRPFFYPFTNSPRAYTAKVMALQLSPETRRRLDLVFRPEYRADAEALLVERCGNNLPFCEQANVFELERLRFAALKLSEGNLSKLRSAVDLANVDWRDLLMAAGFGDSTAHFRWLQPDE